MELPSKPKQAWKSLRARLDEKIAILKSNVIQNEIPVLRQTWSLLALGLAFQYVHTISTRIAHYLHAPREPLYDLGFEFLFSSSALTRLFAELCSKVLGAWAFWIIIRPLFQKTPPSDGLTTTMILVQAVSVLLCVEMLRILAFTATTLPGPAAVCRPTSPGYAPPISASISELVFPLDLFPPSTWFATRPSCGDGVFAWHTSLLLMCALIVTQFGGRRKDLSLENTNTIGHGQRRASQFASDHSDDDDDDEDVTRALTVMRSTKLNDQGTIPQPEEIDLCQVGVIIAKQSFRRSIKVLPWILVLITSFVAISSQIHYSLDIVVAWFTVPLTWVAFDRKLGITARTQQLLEDAELEADGEMTTGVSHPDSPISPRVNDDFEEDINASSSAVLVISDRVETYDDV